MADDEYEQDLSPFRETLGLWVYNQGATIHKRLGTLRRFLASEQEEQYDLISPSEEKASSIALRNPMVRYLTVWRLDDALDMLQLVVRAENGSLYTQIGGLKSLPLLVPLDEYTENDGLETARRLFRDSTPPETT